MNKSKTQKTATILFYTLLSIPWVATFASMPFMEAEARQYGLIQIIVMSVYNIPAIAISGLSLLAGKGSATEGLSDKANFFFLFSILASVIGSGIMLIWGFGLLP